MKTNAIRLLEHRQLQFEVLEYSVADDEIDGISVAKKIGQSPSLVFKTLVTISKDKEIYVFVIPVDKTIDLKLAAKAVGEKKIDMLPQKDLLTTTGYIRGGCSPVGMKKMYTTVIDNSAEEHEKIIVSAGKVGLQLHIAVSDLVHVTHGKLASIAQ